MNRSKRSQLDLLPFPGDEQESTIASSMQFFATVAASVFFTIVGWAAWDFFHRMNLSQLSVSTDGYPLTAELMHETEDRVLKAFYRTNGNAARSYKWPIRLRASGPGVLGETYYLTLDGGSDNRFEIDLAQKELWQSIRLDAKEDYELVNIVGHTDILLTERRFGRTMLRRMDGATGNSLWESPIGRSLVEGTDEQQQGGGS